MIKYVYQEFVIYPQINLRTSRKDKPVWFGVHHFKPLKTLWKNPNKKGLNWIYLSHLISPHAPVSEGARLTVFATLAAKSIAMGNRQSVIAFRGGNTVSGTVKKCDKPGDVPEFNLHFFVFQLLVKSYGELYMFFWFVLCACLGWLHWLFVGQMVLPSLWSNLSISNWLTTTIKAAEKYELCLSVKLLWCWHHNAHDLS